MELFSAFAMLVAAGLVSGAIRLGMHGYEEVQTVRDEAARDTADQNALGFRDAAGRLL